MVTHRDTANSAYVLCGERKITAHFVGDKFSVITEEITCSKCLQIMGKANSKEQSGTYTSLPIQPWHFAETNSLSFLEGCVVKRVCRHRKKDGAQDIDKAIEELKLLKDHLYGH